MKRLSSIFILFILLILPLNATIPTQQKNPADRLMGIPERMTLEAFGKQYVPPLPVLPKQCLSGNRLPYPTVSMQKMQ